MKFISLAFNNIRQIQQYTFVDLRSLIEISLKDNKIERIERKSFMNMDKLKVINLRGNKINTIINEAFQVSFIIFRGCMTPFEITFSRVLKMKF